MKDENATGADEWMDSALSSDSLRKYSESWKNLVLASATFKARNGKPEDAITLFSQLLECTDGSDSKIRAEALLGIVRCFAISLEAPGWTFSP